MSLVWVRTRSSCDETIAKWESLRNSTCRMPFILCQLNPSGNRILLCTTSSRCFVTLAAGRHTDTALPNHRDLNRLIMDYLVIEGYKDAAERFSMESGLSPQVDLESIENRMNIRSAIQRGDVEDAIGRVNELDPEVSEADEATNDGMNLVHAPRQGFRVCADYVTPKERISDQG